MAALQRQAGRNTPTTTTTTTTKTYRHFDREIVDNIDFLFSGPPPFFSFLLTHAVGKEPRKHKALSPIYGVASSSSIAWRRSQGRRQKSHHPPNFPPTSFLLPLLPLSIHPHRLLLQVTDQENRRIGCTVALSARLFVARATSGVVMNPSGGVLSQS